MIIIFAGAGASKAVRPDQYPTTVEFFQKLPEEIKGDTLFKFAVQYLEQSKRDDSQLDIEQVLWLTRDLRDFTSRAADTKSIAGWFLQKERLTSVSGTNDNIRHLQSIGAAATQKIDGLSSRVNALVYDLYGDTPKKEDLQNNWVPLIEGLAAVASPLELVTTNYDIVIEEAIQICKAPVLTGRISGNQPTLDPTLWDLRGLSLEQFASHGRLTKLHGSVDWVRGKNRIHVGTPLFQGKHERHAIIYPGFKGRPTDPLFERLHQYFQARLAEADIVVFVGYAFRDEYINAILERDVSREARIFVLNPVERLPTIPFAESRFVHVRRGFDKDGVAELLSRVADAGSAES